MRSAFFNSNFNRWQHRVHPPIVLCVEIEAQQRRPRERLRARAAQILDHPSILS